ncbi:MAG: hypothetical protein J5I90_02290 [Caldilineales bacterium]|nr:hypothetical protein [Caldilineales bacterium]
MTHQSPSPNPRPIVVLGFGRSGTTWISDIVSKCLGGLVLFEPLHPAVCPFAAEACYADGGDEALATTLESYLRGVLSGAERDRWLLRNHLFSPLEDVSAGFVETIWQECAVIGFKEIRANFMVDWLVERFDARPVYVARHPCAVIASLRRRANFWNEFGWAAHRRFFTDRVLENPANAKRITPAQRQIVTSAETMLEQEAAMWALSHALTVETLDRLGAPVFYYEYFYENPFPATRNLLRYLGHNPDALHPSHVFVPSMTTLRTVHGLTASESDYRQQGLALFWQDVLTAAEVQTIMDVAASLGVTDYPATVSA